jgi:hypothetical protein
MSVVLAAAAAAGAFASPAYSAEPGSVFVELPTSAPLRVFGANNLLVDQLFIANGPSSGPGTYAPPSFLQLLDSRSTTLQWGGDDVGEVHDFVFRDTRDNKLVFGIQVQTEDDFEVNNVFRYGFTGWSTAVAWTFTSDMDLRMYSAARTAVGLGQGVDVFSPDVVDMRSDINEEEGNPVSGLFMIKTDAPAYTLGERAWGVFQAGEEGQDLILIEGSGFVAAVPEPSTYAMMGLGLGGVILLARRRSKKA